MKLSEEEKFKACQMLPFGEENECWEWRGKTWTGYGLLYFSKRPFRTHRLAYLFHKGPIPTGMFVCHSCDNRLCCNPAHLWLGTLQQNNKDMWNKRRHIFGEKCHFHKLSSKDVAEIREIYSIKERRLEGWKEITFKNIAKKYGVGIQAIYQIVHGLSWSRPDWQRPGRQALIKRKT